MANTNFEETSETPKEKPRIRVKAGSSIEKDLRERILAKNRENALKKETKAKTPLRWQEPKLKPGEDWEDPDWRPPEEKIVYNTDPTPEPKPKTPPPATAKKARNRGQYDRQAPIIRTPPVIPTHPENVNPSSNPLTTPNNPPKPAEIPMRGRGHTQYDIPAPKPIPKSTIDPSIYEKKITTKKGGSVPTSNGSFHGPFQPLPSPKSDYKVGGSVPSSDSTGSIPTTPTNPNPVNPIIPTYPINPRERFRDIFYDEVISNGFGSLGRRIAGPHPSGRPYRNNSHIVSHNPSLNIPRNTSMRNYDPMRNNNVADRNNDTNDKLEDLNFKVDNIQQNVNSLTYKFNELKGLLTQRIGALFGDASKANTDTTSKANNNGGIGAAEVVAGGLASKSLMDLFRKKTPTTTAPKVTPTTKAPLTKPISNIIDGIKETGSKVLQKASVLPEAATSIGNKITNMFTKTAGAFKVAAPYIGKAIAPLSMAASLYEMNETAEQRNETIRKIAEDPVKAAKELPEGSKAQKIAKDIADKGVKLTEKEVTKIYYGEAAKAQHIGQRGRIDKVRIEEVLQAAKAGKDPKEADENVKYITGDAFLTLKEFEDYIKKNPHVKEITKRERVVEKQTSPTIQAPQLNEPVVPPASPSPNTTNNSYITNQNPNTTNNEYNTNQNPTVIPSSKPNITNNTTVNNSPPIVTPNPITPIKPEISVPAQQNIIVRPNITPPVIDSNPELKASIEKTYDSKPKPVVNDKGDHEIISRNNIILRAPNIIFEGKIQFPNQPSISNHTNNYDNRSSTEIDNRHGPSRTFGGRTTINQTNESRNYSAVYNQNLTQNNNIPVANVPSNNGGGYTSSSETNGGIVSSGSNEPNPAPYTNNNNRYGSTPSASVSLGSNKGDAKKAMQILIQKGWTPEQAAGIVGNLIQESGLDTKAHNKRENAQGIAQWRNDRIQNFERRYGKSILKASFEEQIDFVHHELTTTERRAGDALKKARTVEEAAQIVDRLYERSAGTETGIRIANAKALMAESKETNNKEETPKDKESPSTSIGQGPVSENPSGDNNAPKSPSTNGNSSNTPNETTPTTRTPTPIQGKPPVTSNTPVTTSENNTNNPSPQPNGVTPVEKPEVTSDTPNNAETNDTSKPENVKVSSNVNLSNMDPELMASFNKAAREFGRPVTITSGFRDDAYQAKLWVRGNILREPGIYMPARPRQTQTVEVNGQTYRVTGSGARGSSHSDGAALDVAEAPAMASAGVLTRHNLSIPFGSSDPVHIQKAGVTNSGNNTKTSDSPTEKDGPVGKDGNTVNNSETNSRTTINNRFDTNSVYNNNRNTSSNNRFGNIIERGVFPNVGIPRNVGNVNTRRFNPGITIPSIKGKGIGPAIGNMLIGSAVNSVINSVTTKAGGKPGTINSPVYSRGNSINVNPVGVATAAVNTVGKIVNSPPNRVGNSIDQRNKNIDEIEANNKKKIEDAFNSPDNTKKSNAPVPLHKPQHISQNNPLPNGVNMAMNVHPSPKLMRELTSTGSQPSIVKSPNEMGIGLDGWGNVPTV